MKEAIVQYEEYGTMRLYGEVSGELVRCKYCKHWECDDSETYCAELGIFGTDINSYCSYAKKKE